MITSYIKSKYNAFKQWNAIRKELKALRKNDPFIYK